MAAIDMEKQPLLAVRDPAGAEEPEPTLAELQQNVSNAQRAYMKAWHRRTSSAWHRRIMFAVTAILLLFFGFCFVVIAQEATMDDEWPISSGKVPLEAHIMSKCPDARDCLHDMVLPAMQSISDLVDFKLSYIGRWVSAANKARRHDKQLTRCAALPTTMTV